MAGPSQLRQSLPQTMPTVGRTAMTIRLTVPRLFDRLQLLARLESHSLTGWNRDFRTGSRVASDAGFARPYIEHAKASQFNAVTLSQGAAHALENSFDSQLSLGLGNAGLVDDFVDDVELDHWLLPAAD